MTNSDNRGPLSLFKNLAQRVNWMALGLTSFTSYPKIGNTMVDDNYKRFILSQSRMLFRRIDI